MNWKNKTTSASTEVVNYKALNLSILVKILNNK